MNGDVLTVTAVTTPTNGTVIVNPDGTVSYTPLPNTNGSDSFDYTISDGNGGHPSATVFVTAVPVNDPPQADNDTAVTQEDTAVTIAVLLNDSNIDGDALTIMSVSPASQGTVTINPDNTLTYTPDPDTFNADSFMYTISDGQGDTATALVTVAVNPVNDPPDAADDEQTTPEDTAVIINVLANDVDVDGNALTIATVTTPTHGIVVINPDFSLTYTPDNHYHGSDTFI